jgi:SAM-dependent methyltransferase
VDAEILDAALHMVAARTTLLAQRGGNFSLTRHYDSEARFTLHQYLGAYGMNAVELGAILRDRSRAAKVVDRRMHAKAFSQTDPLSANLVADLMIQLELDHVLDLGCGAGTLLANLAIRNQEFVGWGLDMNPWMCHEAKKCIASAGAARRVKIFRGDCRRTDLAISPRVRESVRTLCSASVANEFFTDRGKDAVEWLAHLKSLFPGRVLLLADYYGLRDGRELALHNFVQAISGQGIPPASLRAWKRIYRAARCEIAYALELEGLPFFVHLLRL